MRKWCNKCKRTRYEKSFSFRNREKGTRNSWCRDCTSNSGKREYRAKGGYSHRKDTNTKATLRNIQFVLDWLRWHPCVDCGESDPVVLQFDHVRGTKTANVNKLVYSRGSIQTLTLEIEKCEVRCANCHFRKTAKESGWRKYAWADAKEPPKKPTMSISQVH